MTGRIYTDVDFSGELAVVASISDAHFEASLAQLRARDDLIVAFREALDAGLDIGTLSDKTGFSVDRISQMAGWNLTFGDDLNALSGIPR